MIYVSIDRVEKEWNQRKRGTDSGAMNRVRSNELVNIGGGPRGKGLLTVDELWIVLQKRKPLTPELLVAFPVPPKEGLRRWIFRHIQIQKPSHYSIDQTTLLLFFFAQLHSSPSFKNQNDFLFSFRRRNSAVYAW